MIFTESLGFYNGIWNWFIEVVDSFSYKFYELGSILNMANFYKSKGDFFIVLSLGNFIWIKKYVIFYYFLYKLAQ